MLDRDKILSEIDFGTVFSNYCPGIKHEVKYNSPLREDNNASFQANFETGLWQDWGSDNAEHKGDIFQFVQLMEKLPDFSFTLKFVNDNFTNLAKSEESNKDRKKKKSNMKTYLESELQQMIDDLQSGKYHEIEKQIVDRKLSKETLLKLKVGAGLLGYKDKNGKFQKQESLVFPYEIADNGELVMYKKIPYSNGKKIGNLIRTRGTVTIFPKENLQYLNLLICEGELDVLASEGLGIHAVTATGGAGTFKPEHAEYFADKDVILLYDNDKAGIAGQKKAATMLHGIAKSVRIAKWDEETKGFDVSDFSAVGRTPKEFAAILKRAELFKPSEENVLEIRNENDDKKIVDDFREAVKSKNGGFEEDRAALYLFKEIYRNEAGSLILCNTQVGSKKVHYIYKNGYWTEINRAVIAERLQTLLNKAELSYRNPNIQSTMKLLESYCFVEYERFNSRYDIINLDNCGYDLKNFKAIPHDPNHYFTYKTNYSYVADATCPTFEKTVSQYSSNDQTWNDLLLEFMGLSLTDNMDNQSFMMLHGPGGRGKGSVLRFVEKLVGRKRTKSNIDLKQLKDRFSLVAFIGVTLATCGDMPPVFENVDKLKQLTGQDTQTTDTKFGGEVTFTPMCKMWFSSNTLSEIPSNEPLQPFLRRLQILPFQVPIETLDPDIEKKILKEMPGIFNLAIKGYRRLLKNKKFTVCKRSEKLKDAYTANALDLTDEFFNDHIILDPKAEVYTTEIYAFYVEFMNSNSAGGLSNKNKCENPNNLGKRLKQHPKFRHLFEDGTITSGSGRYRAKGSNKRIVTTLYKGLRLISDKDFKNMDDYDEFEDAGKPF